MRSDCGARVITTGLAVLALLAYPALVCAGSTTVTVPNNELSGQVWILEDPEKAVVKAIITKLAGIGLTGVGVSSPATFGMVLGAIYLLTPNPAVSK